MNNSSFLTIPRIECLKVYKDIQANANLKWESAEKLAKSGDYGTAISLAIISIEELIKAAFIYFDGHGFEFRSVKGMNTIFKDHKIRYLIAFAMFFMGVFGEDLKKLIIQIHSNPDQFDHFKKNMKGPKKREAFFNKYLKRYVLKRLVLFRKELIWFSKVDLFRQKGFYSDYTNMLSNPIKITENEYKEVLKRLTLVREVALSFTDFFSPNASTIETAEYLRREFKQKDYYSKLANALAKLKDAKKSPFELLQETLNNNGLWKKEMMQSQVSTKEIPAREKGSL